MSASWTFLFIGKTSNKPFDCYIQRLKGYDFPDFRDDFPDFRDDFIDDFTDFRDDFTDFRDDFIDDFTDFRDDFTDFRDNFIDDFTDFTLSVTSYMFIPNGCKFFLSFPNQSISH